MRILKKYIFLIGFFSIIFSCQNENSLSDSQINKKVDDLISKMTLDEKVGQMTQID